MEEFEFNDLAHTELNKLFEILQEPTKYKDLDTELGDGIIYITLPSDQQYVINKHCPSRQIWLSSPVSGASYFSYDIILGNFVSKEKQEIKQKILTEISSYE